MIGGVCTVAGDGDRADMEALWALSFPEDTAADITAFFDRFFQDGQAFVFKRDARVLSMLFLLPASLSEGQRCLPVGYVYAGATHPDVRGQGCYRRLLRFVRERANERGMAALFLRPADAALADSYRRMGFTVPLTCTAFELSPPNADASTVVPLTAREYLLMRRRFLRDRHISFIDWEDAIVDYALSFAAAVGVGDGAALYTLENDRAVLWELLADEGAREATAAAVCAYSGVCRCMVRTTGTDETIGLLDPIRTTISPAYMGYGLE